MKLYADEQFPYPVVKSLRDLGHYILTVQEVGKANQRISENEVLAFAIENDRAVVQ
jgi:predicted nuclease of predicted toxin-antitoxin system